MRSKRVILQCPCNFMRVGLEKLIKDTNLSVHLDIVDSTQNLAECEKALDSLLDVNFVILTLNSRDYNLASLLQLLGKYLPEYHPNSQVILIGDMAYINVLKCYLGRLKNVRAILSNAITPGELKSELLSIVFSYTGQQQYYKRSTAMLSRRELQVLRMLLEGDKAKQIAEDLQLNLKTVSHHKRAALVKLGVRSLCPLVSVRDKKDFHLQF